MEGLPEKNLIQQLIIMGDPHYLCLFKADFSDRNNIKGDLRVKIHVTQIADISFDKKEFKHLNLIVKFDETMIKLSLIFDNP